MGVECWSGSRAGRRSVRAGLGCRGEACGRCFSTITITTHHIITPTPTRSREFYLEGGAMVLADGGVVCIDEFDKMRPEDRVGVGRPVLVGYGGLRAETGRGSGAAAAAAGGGGGGGGGRLALASCITHHSQPTPPQPQPTPTTHPHPTGGHPRGHGAADHLHRQGRHHHRPQVAHQRIGGRQPPQRTVSALLFYQGGLWDPEFMQWLLLQFSRVPARFPVPTPKPTPRPAPPPTTQLRRPGHHQREHRPPVHHPVALRPHLHRESRGGERRVTLCARFGCWCWLPRVVTRRHRTALGPRKTPAEFHRADPSLLNQPPTQ